MTPQLLAYSFVIGSILLTWAIRALGDWLYPPPRPCHAPQPARTVRDRKMWRSLRPVGARRDGTVAG